MAGGADKQRKSCIDESRLLIKLINQMNDVRAIDDFIYGCCYSKLVKSSKTIVQSLGSSDVTPTNE